MIFISKNLELLRKKAGFKQSELADKLGVKPNTISNYEKGVSSPDYIVVHKLMELFDVTSDQLLYSNLSTEQKSRTLIKEELTESVFDKFLSKIDERDRKLDERETKIDQLQSELRSMTEELATLKALHAQFQDKNPEISENLEAFTSDSSVNSIKGSIPTRKPADSSRKSSGGKT